MDYKRLRIQYFRQWKPKINLEDYNNSLLFPIEEAFLKRVNKSENFFVPFRFKYRIDENYHKQLTFLIDALDFLPLRPDLAFDSLWKSLESFVTYIDRMNNPGSTTNTTDLLKQYVSKWENQITSNSYLSFLSNELYQSMPVQVYEYIVKKSLSEFDPTVPFKDNGQSYKRMALISPNINNLLGALSGIFGYGNLTGKNTRDAAMLLNRLYCRKSDEEDITIPKGSTNVYEINKLEKLSLIVNGLLYTYRNDRFHANAFSPFKSSKATIKTYAFAHFAFLFTYYLVLLLFHEDNPSDFKLSDIYSNVNYNLDLFITIYGRHLNG
ncbi:hypothetical protein [Bacillus wiedmannii]|uniref:hypothetical protein n=1 Tax=Bacillus wiedmannii TaxID=1890302 RepID=UPI001D0E91E3|nr:hypothetical protein [Bacillus wiedmannii]MCC2327140.1 hypothetical protein [Bacillus wiedmannii]